MARTSTSLKFKTIFVCAIALAFLSSCTKKGNSQLKIKIPDFKSTSSHKALSQSVTAAGTDSGESNWGLPALGASATISDFTCFGIMVGGSEPEMSANVAFTQAGAKMFSFGPLGGLVAPNGEITLSVPSGKARTIYLFGFVSLGACETVTNESHELTDSMYSPPYLLGSTTTDLNPGDSTVNLPASFTYGTTPQIGDVKFVNGGSGNGSPPVYIGTGLDGDISIGSNTDLSTYPNNPSPPMTTRYLTSTRPIQAVASNGPNRVKLDLGGTTSTSMNFGDGDEVMIYIPVEHGVGMASGCGANSLYAGERIFGKVSGIPYGGGPQSIDVDFKDATPVLNLTNLTTYADASAGSDYCKAMVTRIPNINRLTISSSATLSVPGINSLISSQTAFGGLLILRLRDKLQIAGGASATFSMDRAGYNSGASTSFSGQSFGGYKISGPGGVASGGGGSYSPTQTSAAGGGNGTAGLEGWSITTSSFSANAGWVSPVGSDLIGRMFMGGGGGNLSSYINNGGGMIQIIAREINIAAGGSLVLSANGGDGDTNSGGGAGGSILLRTLDFISAGNFNVYANGGAAGGNGAIVADAFAGAGGAGKVQIDIVHSCAIPAASVAIESLGGVSGINSVASRSAQNAPYLRTGSASTPSAACNLP